MANFNTADGEPWGDEETDDEAADRVDDAEGELPSEVPVRRSGTRPVTRRPPTAQPVAPPAVAEDEGVDVPCSSIDEVYDRFQNLVWSKLRRPDIGPDSAEGIHQEVFLTMNKLMHEQAPIDHVAALLKAITENQVLNYLRTRTRRPRFDPGVDAAELPSGQPDLARAAEAREIVGLVLDGMAEETAKLILWIDVEGRSHQEIAAKLGCPVRTVQSRHSRARDEFQERALRLQIRGDQGGAS